MLFLIVIATYLLFFILDYLNIKKKQNKKQNILYIILFSFSFLLSLAYVLNIPVPILSHIIRAIMGK